MNEQTLRKAGFKEEEIPAVLAFFEYYRFDKVKQDFVLIES